MLSEDQTTELAELRDLVQSPGFQRLRVYADEKYGDAACLSMIDAALGELEPKDDEGQRLTVAQIRATFKQIKKLLQYPADRVAQLKGASEVKQGPLDRLRRIAR